MSVPLSTRQELPYSLLIDPQLQRAAAYTLNHLLITEEASQELIRFALKNADQVRLFSVAEYKAHPHRRPLPTWAVDDVLERLQIVWIKRPNGDAPDAQWLAIPSC